MATEWKPVYNAKRRDFNWIPCWILWRGRQALGMVTKQIRGWVWSTTSHYGVGTLKECKEAVERQRL